MLLSKPLEKRIKNHLVLSSPFLVDPGLFYGKMGISILFHKLAYTKKEEYYADFATELLDDVLNNIYNNLETPISFNTGLCGIGWGLEYLIHNQYDHEKSLKACLEINRRLSLINPRLIKDLSLETGVLGLLYYTLTHLRRTSLQDTTHSIEKSFIHNLYENIQKINTKDKNFLYMRNQLLNYVERSTTPTIQIDINLFTEKHFNIDPNKLTMYSLGIRNGLAGILLR